MGCEAITQIVQKYKPKLVISGHIHEAFGLEDIGDDTVIVNPGAAKEGRAAIIELVVNEDAVGSKQIEDIKIKLLS